MAKSSSPRSLNVDEAEVVRLSPTKWVVVKVTVSYSEGGLNYFAGGRNRRGYGMHFRVVTKENRGAFTSEGFLLFSGGSAVFLEEAARFNAKRLAQLAATAKTIVPDYEARVEAVKRSHEVSVVNVTEKTPVEGGTIHTRKPVHFYEYDTAKAFEQLCDAASIECSIDSKQHPIGDNTGWLDAHAAFDHMLEANQLAVA